VVAYRCPAAGVDAARWSAAAYAAGRRLLHIDTPSTENIAPICPHFGVCGGCAELPWDTTRYRAWKRDLVVEALREALFIPWRGGAEPGAGSCPSWRPRRRRFLFGFIGWWPARPSHGVSFADGGLATTR